MTTNYKPILACDVDLCVVRSDLGWIDFLNRQSKLHKYNLREDFYRDSHLRVPYINLLEWETIPYDLSKLYSDVPTEVALGYWRQRELYTYLSPIRGSQRGLQTLSEYYDIVFVSHVKGDHHKDKFTFLKGNFPYMKGFMATQEKWFARCNIFIDDRNNHLNSMPEDVIKVRYETKYSQTEEAVGDIKIMKDWSVKEVDKIISYKSLL